MSLRILEDSVSSPGTITLRRLVLGPLVFLWQARATVNRAGRDRVVERTNKPRGYKYPHTRVVDTEDSTQL